MKKKNNYRQIFAKQRELEQVVLKACPNMPRSAGIYFYTRTDEDGKYAYIGKSVDLLKRSVSHLQGYQHIDISLRKRGFYSKDNEGGWKLNFLIFPPYELDDKERFYINNYRNAGYQLYNIESGGTNGKTIINERKPTKGYQDGVAYGVTKTKRKVREFFDKYLDYGIKEPTNKTKERKLEEFKDYLNEDKGE